MDDSQLSDIVRHAKIKERYFQYQSFYELWDQGRGNFEPSFISNSLALSELKFESNVFAQLIERIQKTLSQREDTELQPALQELVEYSLRSQNLQALDIARQLVEETQRWINAQESCHEPQRLWQIDEALHNFPQSIFFIDIEGVLFVGRKLLSQLWIDRKIFEIFDSSLTEFMLIGRLKSLRTSQSHVRLYVESLRPNESSKLWKSICDSKANINLRFPFAQINDKGFEIRSSAFGWSRVKEQSTSLENAEEGFREVCRSIQLKELLQKAKLVFDPACSTGHFLKFIGESYPHLKLAGQDLSEEMIRAAKTLLPKAELTAASASSVSKSFSNADIIFCRFLNSEVVTTRYARNLLINFVNQMKEGAHLILFGHTPVLFDRYDLEKTGLRVHSTHASTSNQSLLQFFMTQK